MKQDFIIIMTTCPNHEEAKRLSSALIETKLAACIQSSQIESTYRWQGVIETEKEVRLLLKTRAELFDEIVLVIQSESSYENPEIISIPILCGSYEYLDWIVKETT